MYQIEFGVAVVVLLGAFVFLRSRGARPSLGGGFGGFTALKTVAGWMPATVAYAAFGFAYILVLGFLVARLEDDSGFTSAQAAAMFSVVAYVTVPAETLTRLGRGQSLSPVEQTMLMRLPESASKLLENIPRMESVRRILYYHQKHYDGEGFPDDSVHGETIPLESRLLKIIADLVRLEARGLDKAAAFTEMNGRQGWYDPNLLMGAEAAFGALLGGEQQGETHSVTVPGLRPGQRLLSNIETANGILLYHAGNLITEAIIERINNHHLVSGIREPIDVMVPAFEGEGGPAPSDEAGCGGREVGAQGDA